MQNLYTPLLMMKGWQCIKYSNYSNVKKTAMSLGKSTYQSLVTEFWKGSRQVGMW